MWYASWMVENMDDTLPFYTDLLGLEVIHTQVQDNEYTLKLVGIPGAALKAVLLKVPEHDTGLSGHIIELAEYIRPKGVKLDTGMAAEGAKQ
jgi:catechol 2,3-dioxygenase-like lactoylglutathione lyase family enzyme